jgi:hypothetical protein
MNVMDDDHTCHMCGRPAKRKYCLKGQDLHSGEIEPCNPCDISKDDKHDLVEHVGNIHSKVLHACSLCDKPGYSCCGLLCL